MAHAKTVLAAGRPKGDGGAQPASGGALNNALRDGAGALAPCGIAPQLPMADLLSRTAGIDALLMKALKPVPRDKFSVAPIQYQALLAEAATAMARAGQQSDRPALAAAADLIRSDLALMNLVAGRRGLIVRG